MLTCFIDESGCPGQLSCVTSQVQPILVIAGIALDTSAIANITRQFARVTQRYHHGQSRPNDICADLKNELIKGSQVRRAFRANAAAPEQKEHSLLDSVLDLLRNHDAKLYGTVVVKSPGEEFDGRAVYSQCLSAVAHAFHRTLEAEQSQGTVIVDFREVQLNGRVSADLMEAKLGPAGDQLPRLLYAPTFGNSEVHAPLQLVDLVCSAILWPIAAWRFRVELAGSPHLAPAADVCIRRRYRRRLLKLLAPPSAAPASVGHRTAQLRDVL